MRLWNLVSVQNPVWRAVGFVLLAGVVAGTVGFVQFGPRFRGPKPEGAVADGNPIGRVGTYVEQLGQGRFLLEYDSIVGQEAELQLKGVHGRLEEPDTLWLMVSPSARKTEDIWILDGPMDIEARDPKGEVVQGKGRIEKHEPGLRWDHGVWTGLSTLVWDDLRGNGKGRWTLPPGWRRELDGRFVVENKPVHWEATAEGALRVLDAQSLVATLGFTHGHLESVQAQMEGGRIQSRTADLDPKTMHWGGPIQFQRDDGWNGTAESGEAPRPEEGGSIQLIDLQTFEAKRLIEAGTEFIQSRGARWTPAGIRAEGDVRWDQPRDGERLVLRAPRVLIREAAGGDLPADLPIGEARAEGTAVLTWGRHSLSSPRMDMQKTSREWRIQSPAQGRGEQGTFSSGTGRGNPSRWEFDGPIKANTPTGGDLRGDRLVWDESAWTITGRPATWSGLRDRVAGPKIVRKQDLTQFPEGIGGSYAAPNGDVAIRADRGEHRGTLVTLTGRVDCQGQDWHLQADQVTLTLGPNNLVRSIAAKGNVNLKGKVSGGRGELLEMDLEKQVVKWQGRVKGLTEVLP
jgi:hypothetical protein